MAKSLTLQELAIQIEENAKAKQDFVAPIDRIRLSGSDTADVGVKLVVEGTQGPATGNVVALRGSESFAVNAIAHGQLAEYVDIPKKYYDRMLAEQPSLLASNVNTWLKRFGEDDSKKGDRRLVRTMRGTARAVLSDRYRPLENEDLAQAVLPVLLDKNLVIVSCNITDRRLYIKAVDQSFAKEIEKRGLKIGDHVFIDHIFPAISIGNSETGNGAVSIETGVYTKGCANLAFIGHNIRKYHTGARAELSDEVYALLSDKTRHLTDAAVWAQVRDVVHAAFDEAQFNANAEKLQASAEDRIVGDVSKAVDVARVHLGLNKSEGAGVLRHLIEGGDLSRYGLFNAVTRSAQDIEDYDRATELERLGGNVIELPKNDWQRIAEAA